MNDRIIGDHCDFVLSDQLGVDLFEFVLRLYLGERLPPGPPPAPGQDKAHAVIDYVVADRAGLLASSPSAGVQCGAEPGVLVSYRPLREKGDQIAVTRTNRDYLGVITAIGPDAAAVELSVAAMRANGNWEITEPVSDRCRQQRRRVGTVRPGSSTRCSGRITAACRAGCGWTSAAGA